MEIYQETTSLPDDGHTERMDDVTAPKKPPLCFHALALDVGDHLVCVGRTLRRHRSTVGPGNDGEHRLAGHSSSSFYSSRSRDLYPAKTGRQQSWHLSLHPEQVQYKRVLDNRSAIPKESLFIVSAREMLLEISSNPFGYSCCAKQLADSSKASSPSSLPAVTLS